MIPFLRLLFISMTALRLFGCADKLPASYWPYVPCPEQNKQDVNDVCLINHPYQTREYETNMDAYSAAVTPDGRWTAIGGGSQDPVLLVDMNTGSVEELLGTFGVSFSVAFSPNGSLLATTAATNEQKTHIDLWEVMTKQKRHELHGTAGGGYFQSVGFTPDGKALLAGRDDGTVTVWDLSSGSLELVIKPTHRGGINNLSVSSDSSYVVVASQFTSSYVTVYSLQTGEMIAELDLTTLGDEEAWVASWTKLRDVEFSPDGEWIAIAASCYTVGCQATMWLWNPTTGELRAFEGHTWDVTSVIFHPDGRWVASGGVDNTIRIWDWRTGAELYRMVSPLSPRDDGAIPNAGGPGGDGLGTSNQGMWAPVDQMSITADGSTIVYSEPANGQVRIWRLPEELWR